MARMNFHRNFRVWYELDLCLASCSGVPGVSVTIVKASSLQSLVEFNILVMVPVISFRPHAL